MGWILIIIMEKGVMKKGINGTVVKGNNRTTIEKRLDRAIRKKELETESNERRYTEWFVLLLVVVIGFGIAVAFWYYILPIINEAGSGNGHEGGNGSGGELNSRGIGGGKLPDAMITPSSDYISGKVMISPPFYVNSWSVKSTGVVLELVNQGGWIYEIKEVKVSNCGRMKYNKVINIESKDIFTIPCSLNSGDDFKGDITVNYVKEKSSLILTSGGEISERVV